MDIKQTIDKWKLSLGLGQWAIKTKRIAPEQVMYNDDCPEEDRFFIGIQDLGDKVAIIYHDIDLYEEAIVHELLHVKYPDKDEDWINAKCEELISKQIK